MPPETPSEPIPSDRVEKPEPDMMAPQTEPQKVAAAPATVEASSCALPAGRVARAAPPVSSAKFSFRLPPWAGKAAAVAEPLSLAIVFVYLLAKSWMRWPDPIIDFPRDLYIAWRVSVGDTLYEKVAGSHLAVASWYGPLAHLAEAAAFRIFGVGMDTVVWMNVVLAAGIVLLFRGIFRAVGNRFSAWLCVMIFLLVFLVGHLVDVGNYNFITPYVAQTTYGLAGLLLVVWTLLWHLRSDWGWWLWLAGVGLGVTYLDKPEPLLAAAGALGVYGAARLVHRYRQAGPRGGRRRAVTLAWTSAVWVAVGFFTAWATVFLYFFAKGGAAYALRATDWVTYTMLAGSFQKTVAKSYIFSSFFGFDRPLQNFLSHLQAGTLLLLVCGVMVAASRAWAGAAKYSLWWWLGPAVTVAAGGLGAWLGAELNGWVEIGEALNFSTVLLAAVVVGWCGWAAWGNRDEFARSLGLAVIATPAALMLARMILHGRIYHYGFFLAPLAVLFVVHWMVAEGARAAPGQRRRNWLLPVVFGLVALYGGHSLAGLSLRVYAQKTFAVGAGRDRFYTFQPPPPSGVKAVPGAMYSARGLYLNEMLAEAAKALPKAKTIIAFPESAAVNYHLRVPSPVPEVEFHPTGLGFVGPEHVLAELKANPPGGVFFYMRDMLEYGVPYFGYDEGSGKAILDWVAANYTEIWNFLPRTQFYNGNPNIPLTPTGDAIDLLTPKTQSGLPSAEQLMNSIGTK